MYNEFGTKHYKGKRPCTTETLYNEKTLIGRLHQYFLPLSSKMVTVQRLTGLKNTDGVNWEAAKAIEHDRRKQHICIDSFALSFRF